MFDGNELFETGEESILVLNDRSHPVYPIVTAGEFDVWPPAARKPRDTQLDLHGLIYLIDSDYCGVHLPPLF